MKILKQILVALSCIALMTSATRAGIVGVDVSGATYTGPGVLNTTSRTWDSVGDLGTFVLDGDVITVDYGGHGDGSIGTPAINLYQNYQFTTGTPYGVSLMGLDPTKDYNLVVYSAQAGFGGRGGRFVLAEGGVGDKSTTGDQQATFAEGVNYVRFDGLQPDNFVNDSRVRFLVNVGTEGVGIFNGFEIESVENTGGVAAAGNTVVNVDLGATGAYNGQGAIPSAGNTWTQIAAPSGGANNLVDSTGAATEIDLILEGSSVNNGSFTTASTNGVTQDYIHDGGTGSGFTVTLRDLGFAQYDIALYAGQDFLGGRGATFTINGVDMTATADFTGLDANGFGEGDNYVLFNRIVPVNGFVTINVSPEVDNITIFDGLQLRVVPVPESGSFVLISLGLAGLAGASRRRRRS